MRYIVYSFLALFIFIGCKKENHGSKVDIYLLDSFTIGTNPAPSGSGPFSTTISNAVLASTPLVADRDIKFYTRSSSAFKLRNSIKTIIQNYGPDKAFAVTVDGEPVYYGKFHPAYLSSMTVGLATIDPILLFANDNELPIQFINLTGTLIAQDDKRNDPRIINALRETGRLR
ncbi:MAG: hypothetical protein ABIR18_03695 [Chitinophagaceae bacterium]